MRRLPIIALLLLAACAAPRPTSRADLEAHLLRNPEDVRALRDLGVVYARERNFPKASETLLQAFERQPNDPQTLYYLGLVSETLNRTQQALRLYERWDDVPAASPYRDALRGRYQWLLRREVRQELRDALAQEEALAQVPTDGALAVMPLTFRAGEARFEPLGRGLAEMIAVDLAAVEGLTLVERVRLQALLGEIELARSGQIDPATAPRYGRLLRASRLVGGQYSVRDRELRVDAGVYEASDEGLPDLASTSGAVDRLFALQKEIVAGLLVSLGVTPTPAQLARIQRIPTQNSEAFLAFSRGLGAEDREAYADAAGLYRRAVALDPTFQEAAQKAAECEAIAAQSGPAGDLIAAAGTARRMDMLGMRMGRLNSSLSALIVPGPETRTPEVEGIPFLGPLDTPPNPPSGGGN
jgi:tetratricopeptide (TPR) repeat protein